MPLPPHSYEGQFSPSLDFPDREWADRFFLIASTPRSGSHYLGHMLMDVKEYGVPLEYLSENNSRYWRQRFQTDDLDKLFPHFVRHRTSYEGIFTFKAHWQQFEPYCDRVHQLTRGRGIEKVIWISRKDILAQAISFVIAQQTGAWISGARERGQPRYRYGPIVAAAGMILRSNLNWKRYLEVNYQGDFFAVTFEEIVKNDSAKLDDVRKFLGGKKTLQAPQRTSKQGSGRNAEWRSKFTSEIKNEDEWILENPIWLNGTV